MGSNLRVNQGGVGGASSGWTGNQRCRTVPGCLGQGYGCTKLGLGVLVGNRAKVQIPRPRLRVPAQLIQMGYGCPVGAGLCGMRSSAGRTLMVRAGADGQRVAGTESPVFSWHRGSLVRPRSGTQDTASLGDHVLGQQDTAVHPFLLSGHGSPAVALGSPRPCGASCSGAPRGTTWFWS